MFKEITELRLKIDVERSLVDGLESEKKHQALEITETNELLAIFQKKNEALVEECRQANIDLKGCQRELIQFVLTTKKKDEKIIILKTDLSEIKSKFEVIEVAHNALVITH